MVTHTKELIDVTINDIDELIKTNEKVIQKLTQIKKGLVRRRRALDDKFWFDQLSAREKDIEFNKGHLQYPELFYNVEQFRKIHRRQWDLDREQILEEQSNENM